MRTPQRHRLMLDDQRFGSLTVIAEAPRRPSHRYWRCRCDCGPETVASQVSLRSGAVVSCGCRRANRLRMHGRSHGPEYADWRSMRQRCGERELRIAPCPQWEDVATFLRDVGPLPSPKHRLVRLDLDGGFSPDNCAWATESERDRL